MHELVKACSTFTASRCLRCSPMFGRTPMQLGQLNHQLKIRGLLHPTTWCAFNDRSVAALKCHLHRAVAYGTAGARRGPFAARCGRTNSESTAPAAEMASLAESYGIHSLLSLCNTPFGFGLCWAAENSHSSTTEATAAETHRASELFDNTDGDLMACMPQSGRGDPSSAKDAVLVAVPLHLVLSPFIANCSPEALHHPALKSVLQSDLGWELKIGAMLLWAVRCCDGDSSVLTR